MFVGETGVSRVIQRTLELMKEAPAEDVTALGGIPLEIIQRYVNRWFSVSMDLFGGEDSSNAASYFAAGLKGRFNETHPGKYEDHLALDQVYSSTKPTGDGGVESLEVPMRRAMNLVLRDEYKVDCEKGVQRWNKLIKRAGVDFEITLPSERFHRGQGLWANQPWDPNGNWVGEGAYQANLDRWIPSEADETYVASLMSPVYEVGKIANWIAPPRTGIDNNSFDFEYVKFADDPYARL